MHRAEVNLAPLSRYCAGSPGPAAPLPFPLLPGSAVCRAAALARRISLGNGSQWRWANTELQRTPNVGRLWRRGR